jgi:type IV pilus assembly protein PilW
MKCKPVNEESGRMPCRSSVVTSQRGFSLIELMIAILISVFLIGGLLTLVQAMKRTTMVQGGLSQLQDNERFASDLLANVIQAAGDYPSPVLGGQFGVNQFGVAVFPVFPVPNTTITFAAGQTIAGATTATAPGDLIAVRYSTSGTAAIPPPVPDGLISCAGNTSATPVQFVNLFRVAIDAQGNGTLQCQLTTIDSTGVKANVTSGPFTLVSGITKLKIFYGVQTNTAATTLSVDSYLTATQVSALATPLPLGATTGWNMVKSVQLVLTVTNPLFGQPSQPATIQLTRVINVMNQVGEGQT